MAITRHIGKIPSYKISELKSTVKGRNDFEIFRFENFVRNIDHLRYPHRHEFYLLLYISSGKGSHDIDFNNYSLESHRQFFISPNQVHSWQEIGRVKGYVILFTKEFYSIMFRNRELQEFSFFDNIQTIPFLDLEKETARRIANLMKIMEIEYESHHLFRDNILRSFLNVLLFDLARIYHPVVNLKKAGRSSQIIRMFDKLIDTHYRTHRTAGDYAGLLHITPNYLNGVCKSVTGKSSGEYIRDRQLLEAKRLLVHTNNSVAQIAYDLNFEDNSYFGRFFKRGTGVAPAEFRRKARMHTFTLK